MFDYSTNVQFHHQMFNRTNGGNCYGGYTVAYKSKVVDGKELLFVGYAYCSSVDNFCRATGRKIAEARLTEMIDKFEANHETVMFDRVNDVMGFVADGKELFSSYLKRVHDNVMYDNEMRYGFPLMEMVTPETAKEFYFVMNTGEFVISKLPNEFLQRVIYVHTEVTNLIL